MNAEYTIVQSTKSAELCRRVTALLADGWRPIGGVSTTLAITAIHYSQALIRVPEPPICNTGPQ